MNVLGTKTAFELILRERGVYKKIGVDRATVSNWKRALAGVDKKNMPSIDKMEEILTRYGAVVVREKVWQLNSQF